MDDFKMMAKAMKINALAICLGVRLPVTVQKKLLSELLKEADVKLGLNESQDLDKHFKQEETIYNLHYNQYIKEQTAQSGSGKSEKK